MEILVTDKISKSGQAHLGVRCVQG